MSKRFSSEWVTQEVGTFENLVHMRFADVPESYDYSEKNNVRSFMVDQAKLWFTKERKKPKLRILTLPHVNCIDLYEFSRVFKIDSGGSLLVEHNPNYARYLAAWKQAGQAKLSTWGVFKGINLLEGKISAATEVFDGKFEVVFLDFNGPWNREVVSTLKNLFTRQLFAAASLLFLTINDTERWRIRSALPARRVVPSRVFSLTNNTAYSAHRLWYMDWTGEGGSKMITFAFSIESKEKADLEN